MTKIIQQTQKEKDYIFLELTRSICPVCKKTLDAQIRVRNDKVYMFKRCFEHGEFEALISSDINMYTHSLAFNKPGQSPLEYGSVIKLGCPDDCGICPNHQQHTCLALLEVTDDCNLCCASCYAQAQGHKFLDLETIDFMLNQYVRYEGHPEVLQISGGEPTLHPEIFKIIELAKSKKIRHLMLNTNGIRLVEDEDFARELSKLDVEVYLQFDGFDPAIYARLRGSKEIFKLKQAALEIIAKYNIPTTLVATLVKDLNETQVGQIIEFAIKNRFIKGVTFQPIIYLNNNINFDPLDRLTLPDVVKAIEKQTKSLFKVSDFIPLPCPYPTCCSLTYAYIRNGEVIPITRKIDVEKYLDYISNRIITSPAVLLRKSLERLWSASATLSAGEVLNDFSCVCGLNFSPGILDQLKNNVLRIVVKPFMDAYTFDFKRAMKCCIHVLRPNGKLIPFCVYNNIYRGKGL
ncbi:MAG: radical SAM protein [Candidatus Omnitrophica bacterium]|nr:radical SAM protein [Candidatus Omnitrophota bacterium]